MQTIKKDELFHNLGGFLKSKGIELNDGSYTTRIKQGCNLLSDAINVAQKTVKKTKAHVDHALDQLRESIHQSTAPNRPRQTKSSPKSRKKRPANTANASRNKARAKG